MFEDNKALGNDAFTGYGEGRAIYCEFGDLDVDNTSFTNNHAGCEGGAIYCENGYLTLNDAVFSNNKAPEEGGAIYMNEWSVKCDYSTFEDNSAKYGGAIYAKSYATFENSVFKGNSADKDGGALYIYDEIELIGCNLTNNKAKVDGGAVFCKAQSRISVSKFKGNEATGATASRSFGGAVRSYGELSVYGSLFEDNFAYNHGGALYGDEDVLITSSKFNDNKVNCDGGAVYGDDEVTISDSSFDKNEATGKTSAKSFGGAVHSEGLATLKNSNFTNNAAYKKGSRGGAVYADEEIRINGCYFESNEAHDGGAVYTSTIKKTVSHSIFISNDATDGDGGAVYIFNKCDPEFISCRFEKNHAKEEGGAMYLDSSHSELSVSYSTFVDNKADESGQSVYNCGYYYLVDKCWLGKNNPGFKDQFKIWHKAAADEDFTPTGVLSIDIKADANEFYIGNTYELTVYFRTVLSTVLSEDLLHSDAKFSGDGEFSNVIVGPKNNMTADVVLTNENPTICLKLDNQIVKLKLKAKNKISSNVTIRSCEDVIYPGVLKVDYEIVNMSNAKYTIYLKNGMAVTGGSITDSKSTLTVENLEIGEYSIDIFNAGNESINPSRATAHFKVNRYMGTVNVTADNVTYGENTTINLRAEIDGLYNVSINGTVLEMEAVGGIASKQIKLNAGNYQTHTSAGDNIVLDCNEASFTVFKANPNFKINAGKDEFTYGEDVFVTHELPPDAGSLSQMGAFAYYINNVWYANFELEDEVILTGLNVGSYFIKAYYSGDNNYLTDSANVSFTVKQIENHAEVSVSSVTYGEKSIIEVIADVDGTYCVNVNGKLYDINVKNGAGNKSIELEAGSYFANVTFNDDNYNTSTRNTTFKVYKANIDMIVVVFDEVYGDDIECIVYSSRDGEYTMTIAGDQTHVNVKDNFAYLEYGTLDAGSYQASVSFAGNRNYNPAFNITGFTVYPRGTLFEFEISASEITYGDTATVTPVLSEGATGNVSYYLGDGTFLDTLDVGKNLTLPVLDAGSYIIIGNYSGDRDFNPATDTTFLTVKQASNNVILSVSDVTYGNETLIELSADADGIYKIDINGTIYNLSVENGYANRTVSFDAGKYYANVTFDNKNYNTRTFNTTFEVYKADVNIIVAASDTVYPHELEGIVYSDVDGDYNLTLGNYSIVILVKNGSGEFNLGVLDADSYQISANYSGDKNYNPAGYALPVTVAPARNNATVYVSNVTYGEESVIEVVADFDGTYCVDVNGTSYDVNVKDGVGNRSIELEAGSYFANVSFNNNNYNTSTHNTTFTVYKADIDLLVVVFGEVYGDEIECIVYSSMDGEYNLTIAGYSTLVKVKNNFTYFEHGTLDAGTYEANVSFAGNHNYNSAFYNTEFTVYPANSSVSAEDVEVTYGDSIVVVVDSENATGVSYQVISSGAVVKQGTVNVGENITGLDLGVGEYSVNLTTVVNGNYTVANYVSKIIVNPANSSVCAEDVEVTYGDSIVVVVDSENATGVSYQVISSGAVVKQGTVNVGENITGLVLGVGGYSVNLTTVVNGNYTAANCESKITVKPANSSVNSEDVEVTYGDSIVVVVDSENATEISYKVIGVGGVVKEGSVNVGENITGLDLAAGDYTVNLTTVVNRNYTSANCTSKITVNPANSSVSAKDAVASFGDAVLIPVSSVNATEISYTITDTNDKAVANGTIKPDEAISISALAAGDYTVSLNTVVDTNHTSVSNTSKLHIKHAVTITIAPVSGRTGEVVSFNVGFKYENGDFVNEGNAGLTIMYDEMELLAACKYSILSADESVPVSGGKATFNIKLGNPGIYPYVVTYSGGDADDAQAESTLTILKVNTTVSAAGLSGKPSDKKDITVTVLDQDKNPVINGTVALTLNGKTYNADVENGKAVLSVELPNPGEYDAAVTYNGNDYYNSSTSSISVNVEKLNTKTSSAKDVSGKSGEKTDIKVKIVDEKGNPVKNGTATLTVADKTYAAEVIDGIATFKDVVIPSKNTVADVHYHGNDYYNASSSTFFIKVKHDNNNTNPDNNNTDENKTVKNVTSNATGNPIAMFVLALFSLVITYRKKN